MEFFPTSLEHHFLVVNLISMQKKRDLNFFINSIFLTLTLLSINIGTPMKPVVMPKIKIKNEIIPIVFGLCFSKKLMVTIFVLI